MTCSDSHESHENTQLIDHAYSEDLVQIKAGTVLVALVSVSSYTPCLVSAEGLVLLLFSRPSGTIFLPLLLLHSLSSEGRHLMETSHLDSLHMVSGCEFLHLLPPAAEGSLSDDNRIRPWFMSIAEYH